MSKTFERYTDRARRVLVLAKEESAAMKHGFIGPEHLLLGLIGEGGGVAYLALTALGLTYDEVREHVVAIVPEGDQNGVIDASLTAEAKKVIELSLREALALGHNYIGTEHVLLALDRIGDGVAFQVLEELGARDKVRGAVIELLAGYSSAHPARGATKIESIRAYAYGHANALPPGPADVALMVRCLEAIAAATIPPCTVELLVAGGWIAVLSALTELGLCEEQDAD